MAQFKIGDAITEKAEGGFNPNDHGARAYKGINEKYNPTWAGWKVIDGYQSKGPIKEGTIFKDAALEQLVQDYYKKQYWDTIDADKINSQDVADIFYDMHVNSGAAVKIMQTVVSALGKKVTINNKMGADTLAAINALNPADVFNNYRDARKAYYTTIEGKSEITPGEEEGLLARVDRYFPTLKKKPWPAQEPA